MKSLNFKTEAFFILSATSNTLAYVTKNGTMSGTYDMWVLSLVSLTSYQCYVIAGKTGSNGKEGKECNFYFWNRSCKDIKRDPES